LRKLLKNHFWIVFLLGIAGLFVFVGCQNEEDSDENEDSTESQVTVVPTESATDIPELSGIVVGADAPAFTLANALGDPVSLSDYQGQPVLLFFHMAVG
jgi:cytochrome oxidase Cu insertion factor (SCO1/SenC/PrrC family)